MYFGEAFVLDNLTTYQKPLRNYASITKYSIKTFLSVCVLMKFPLDVCMLMMLYRISTYL